MPTPIPLIGTWDNVNTGWSEVFKCDTMAIEVKLRHICSQQNGGFLDTEETSTDSYKLTREFFRSDWESMDRYDAAENLMEELRCLVRTGAVKPKDHVYQYIDGTHEVVKPTTNKGVVMQNLKYLEHIGNALRIVVAAKSISRDEFLESECREMIRRYSGESAALLEPETVDAAKERLDVFTGALARAVDAETISPDDLCNYLVSICSMATKYDSLDEHGTIEIRYYHSYNGVYSIRAGETITKMLKEVAERCDSGFLLAAFSVASHYGMLKRAARSGRFHRVHRTINELQLEEFSDCSEVIDLLYEHDYHNCNDCDEWEHTDNLRNNNEGNDVCPVCIDNHYTWSDYYDRYLHNDQAQEALDQDGETVYIDGDDCRFSYDDDLGVYVHQDYTPQSKVLRRYHTAKNHNSYKLIPSPFTQVTGRYMGIELEVEVSDRNARNLNDTVEALNTHLNDDQIGANVWFEEDGSLSHGFEIISNPMGLDTHTEFWQWLNDDSLVKGLRSHDTSTCGLHIHINKSALTTMQIDKMNVFINHPDNAELIEKISRRYSTGYARINAKKLGSAHNSYERYEALNITNQHTIEMRIFKGTLKYTSLMAALEFANALVNFTAPASPAGFRLDTRTFMKFLDLPAYRNETKFLRNYLEARSPQTL
jgi:hypothetical protein